MKSMNGWIAASGFALLAMTNAGIFSSLPQERRTQPAIT
jgi:hypothetical protein